jgi:arsenate reductase (glutaredoxin)
MIIVYGIPNCDSVKKTRSWLVQRALDYRFHDVKKDKLSPKLLEHWLNAVGWETLLNRKGTTWRKLSEFDRGCVNSAETATVCILANPTIFKRPVISWPNGQLTVGFNEPSFEKMMAS